jgi:hypothetical protein
MSLQLRLIGLILYDLTTKKSSIRGHLAIQPAIHLASKEGAGAGLTSLEHGQTDVPASLLAWLASAKRVNFHWPKGE